MSIIFMDGFDIYNIENESVTDEISDHWSQVVGNGSGITTEQGRYDFSRSISLKSIAVDNDIQPLSSTENINPITELRLDGIYPQQNGERTIIGFNCKIGSNSNLTIFTLFTDGYRALETTIEPVSHRFVFRPSIVEIANRLEITTIGNSLVPSFLGFDQWRHVEIEIIRFNELNFDLIVHLDGVNIYDTISNPSLNRLTRSTGEDYCTFQHKANKNNSVSGREVDTESSLFIDDFYVLNNSGTIANDLLGRNIRITHLIPQSPKDGIQNWARVIEANEGGSDSVSLNDPNAVLFLNDIPARQSVYITDEFQLSGIQEYNFGPGFVTDTIDDDVGSQLRSHSRSPVSGDLIHILNNSGIETFFNIDSDFRYYSSLINYDDFDVSGINFTAGVGV